MSKSSEWFMECCENGDKPFLDDTDYWYEQWLKEQSRKGDLDTPNE